MKGDQLPSIKEMRNAVPPHCFVHNNFTSLSLVVRDALVIGTLWYLAWNYLPFSGISPVGWVAWNIWWFLSGTALTG